MTSIIFTLFKVILRAILDLLADWFWPVSRMFDTPALDKALTKSMLLNPPILSNMAKTKARFYIAMP